MKIRDTQKIYEFPNGYGASVISDGYGSEDGLLELAVLDERGHICYDTPITNDVLGYQTVEQVEATLKAIEALPHKGSVEGKRMLLNGQLNRALEKLDYYQQQVDRIHTELKALDQ